ncbi:unnamed protein product [Owenia fusiformis]|uniref:5'-3' exoribonuclease 1 n=1 Tax=Owenia fusiformis TaxID=6347 RepID=A0A8S4N2T0_OWEFU|nr:unnamed protein product [Owenia fusiformis]
MGVPKFYRWISERYPCLSEVVKEYQIPEFDNLYLDMNGVVHTCSHPEDDNPHFRITEEKIFADIFHYLEVLFRMIKPRKVFFMAIDGVAPRAKMNQQRGRRFRSAREAENLVRKALEAGEILPEQQRFDSNCITPGTEFMQRLQDQLKYFVTNKVSTDKMWQGCRVYLSGHEVPGEGEHKVMDFIRYEKSQPGYDPNTRHCLYGLDADLIMLGLISHEPHFSLLREEVRFGGKNNQKRATSAEETVFHLLHLTLLREYLDFEFASLKGNLPFDYNIENIIDDWVLMGFLVGNDFIPHLPDMHIKNDALPLLWKTYMEALPQMDGYINENGHLNLPRFKKYLEVLSRYDIENFSNQYFDLKWLEGKGASSGAKLPRLEKLKANKPSVQTANQFSALDGSTETPEISQENDDIMVFDFSDDEQDDVEEYTSSEDDDEEDDDDGFKKAFTKFKRHYYMDKLKIKKVTPEALQEQAVGYVRGIQWILHYYYNGVPSWSWYFEHHYAPYMSDVARFPSDMTIEFELSTPFLPFEQLMAVLPAASKNLLPKPHQSLMVMDNSPIIDFYPVEFESDLNGKQQDWEAVVLIPFIDEKRLLEAMAPMNLKMTDEEKARNQHGPHYMVQYTPEMQEPFISSMPDAFPDILANHAKLTLFDQDIFRIPRDKINHGLCPGVRLDVYFPGFPTLKHIRHTASLKKAGVKVFQQQSRGENMILQIQDDSDLDLEQTAHDILGTSVFVNWPHLYEAKVVEISDDQYKYSLVEFTTLKGGKKQFEIRREEMNQGDVALWHRWVNSISEMYSNRRGVDISPTLALIKALPMQGRKYICGQHGSNITLEKQWAANPGAYVLQSTVRDIAVHDETFTQYRTLPELFPVNSTVFMLGSPHYGAEGKVVAIDPGNDGRISVEFSILVEPDLDEVRRKKNQLSVHYMPGYVIAQRTGISSHLLSRITGTIYLFRGSTDAPLEHKLNVGLNLKFNKKGEEVPGYTKKNDGTWLYSTKALKIIQEYIEKFPELFEHFSQNQTHNDNYYEEDVFGSNSKARINDLSNFLKQLPSFNSARAAHGSDSLDDLVIKAIEEQMEKVDEMNKKKKRRVKMQVRPHLLFRPLGIQGTLTPDSSATYEVFDRVVNIRDGFSVPMGLRGTVVAIQSAEKEQDIIYEVVFDAPFMGGLTIRCSASKAYRMPGTSLINLSHGVRKEQGITTPIKKTPTKPQFQNQQNRQQRGAHNNSNNNITYANSVAINGPMRRPGLGYEAHHRQQNEAQLNQGAKGQYAVDNNIRQQQQNIRSQQQQSTRSQQDTHKQQYETHKQQNDTPKKQNDMHKQQQKDNHRQQPVDLKEQREQYLQQKEQKRKMYESRAPKPKQDNEFANIWQQLQSSAVTEDSILAQAAKVLPTPDKVKPKEDTTVKAPMDKQMTRVDVDTLFKAKEQPSATKDNEEFNDLFNSLKVSEEKKQPESSQDKDPSAALCEMLKIGGSTPTKSTPKEATDVTTNKTYGKQVSVQELFRGAQKQSTPTKSDGHQPKTVKQANQQSSAVLQLLSWCQQMKMAPPKYDYIPHQNKPLVSACIALADGRKFQGSATKSKEQAAASAASMAMLQLRTKSPVPPFNGPGPQQQQMQPQIMGRGGIMTSPTSAFTPVQPRGNFSQYPINNQGAIQQQGGLHGGPQRFPGYPTTQPGFMPGHHQGNFQQQQPFRGGYPHPQGGQQRPQGQPYPQGGQGGPQRPRGQPHPQGGQQRPQGGPQRPQAQPYPQGGHQQFQQRNGHPAQPPFQQHGGPRQQQGSNKHTPTKGQIQQQRENTPQKESTPTKPNAFVPMQVTKKQVTPQRSLKKETDPEENENKQISQTEESEQQSKSLDSSKPYAPSEQCKQNTSKTVPQAKSKKSPPRNSDGAKPKPRKGRSRLAINFGAPSQ